MAFGHKAFTKSRPNRKTNVKIWVEVYAKVECSTKRRLEGRLEGRHTHKTTTPNRPILVPSSKKTTFCRNFPSKHLELSKRFHTFAVRKTFTHTHSHIHPHNRVFFETTRYLSSKGRVQNDGRRETKDWNIQRHRHGHQP